MTQGYDAHVLDPLAALQFRTRTYHALVGRLRALSNELCGGRMMLLLEGGYSLAGLARGVADSCRALLGEDPADAAADEEAALEPEPLAEVHELIARVRAIHGIQ